MNEANRFIGFITTGPIFCIERSRFRAKRESNFDPSCNHEKSSETSICINRFLVEFCSGKRATGNRGYLNERARSKQRAGNQQRVFSTKNKTSSSVPWFASTSGPVRPGSAPFPDTLGKDANLDKSAVHSSNRQFYSSATVMVSNRFLFIPNVLPINT